MLSSSSSSLLYHLLIVLIFTATSYCILAIDDIPSRYISSIDTKSLFCNECGILTSIVNDSLHDESTEFETLVGFRLDSNGKKIRKKSAFLKLYLSLEDVCDNWKEKYRTAKRKNGYLYLIEDEVVRELEKIEKQRRDKLTAEAGDRLREQWKIQWEKEQIEQQKLYNNETTHDEEQTNHTQTESESESEKKEDGDEEEEEKEEVSEPKYFYEKKPKLIKRKSKNHKIVKEMCYFINEKFDEWLHEQQKIIAKKMKEDEDITDYLVPQSFCLEDGICEIKMFDINPQIFKYKKELKLPKKPKHWRPPIDQKIIDDYDEMTEDDDENTETETENNDDDDKQNSDDNDNDSNDNNEQKTEL